MGLPRCPRGPVRGGTGALLPLLALSVLVTAACATTSASDPAPPADDVAATTAPPDVVPSLCRDGSVTCASTADGSRWAVLRSGDAGAPLVLWEPGGPGLDLLQAPDTVTAARAGMLRGTDVLILAEPWTASGPTDGCRREADDLVAALRTPGAEAGRLSTCAEEPLGWTADRYRSSLSEALDELDRPLAGVLAESFGATRLPVVSDVLAPGARVLLHTPAPPPGDVGDLLDERAAALHAALAGRGIDDPAGTLRRAVVQDGPVVDTGPVTGRELGWAVLAAAYDLQGNEAFLHQVLTQWPGVGPEAALSVRRLSSSLLFRLGDGTTLDELPGYFAGTCAAYTAWPAPEPAPDGVAGLLRVLHAPCTDPLRQPGGWVAEGPLDVRSCVVLNDADPVTPAGWGERWAAQLPGATVLRYAVPGHGRAQPEVVEAASAFLRGETGDCG